MTVTELTELIVTELTDKIKYNRKDSNKADSDSGDSNIPGYDIIIKELMVTEL